MRLIGAQFSLRSLDTSNYMRYCWGSLIRLYYGYRSLDPKTRYRAPKTVNHFLISTPHCHIKTKTCENNSFNGWIRASAERRLRGPGAVLSKTTRPRFVSKFVNIIRFTLKNLNHTPNVYARAGKRWSVLRWEPCKEGGKEEGHIPEKSAMRSKSYHIFVEFVFLHFY